MTPTQQKVVYVALILVTALTIKFLITDKPADSGLLLLLGPLLGAALGVDAAKTINRKAESAPDPEESIEPQKESETDGK